MVDSFATIDKAQAEISDNVIRIGVMTDLSGVYSDADGRGSVEAVKLAVEDMGGIINGKRVEVVIADHLNKADVAVSKAREWFDRDGVDVILGGGASSAALPMAQAAAERKKVFFAVGVSSARFTNEECTPFTIHYAYDTVALGRSVGAGVTKAGGKTWYTILVDYAFGQQLAADTKTAILANGGKVLGEARHPMNNPDFSPLILQAQSSGAQVFGIANSGHDAINTLKAVREFGLNKTMKLAGPLLSIAEVDVLGLDLTQGLNIASNFYWDENDATRAWSKRYFAVMKKNATMAQAGNYSAALTYMKAVRDIDSDASDAVMKQLKTARISDMFAADGYIRADGRMIADMGVWEAKAPSESKYSWDYLKKVGSIPGEQAYTQKSETKCALWK
jgi:branched-chain amino acid transport system substrate-binding protein